MSTKEQEDLAETAEEIRQEELFHPHDRVGLPLPPPLTARPMLPFGLGIGLKKPSNKVHSLNADLQKSWVLHDFSIYLGQSTAPRDRIRELDRLRFHNLHPEDECVLLRLPSRRIDIQSMKDVIMLCGGLVGVRFESTELKLISSSCADLERTWGQLDRLYKSMPSAVTKMGSTTADIDMQQVVEDFHALCDNYIHDLQNIQDVIKAKQATIDRTIEPMKIEADPSSNFGSPYPKWLIILREKFEKIVAENNAAIAGEISPKVSSASSVFALGKFSVFLSHAIQHGIEFSPEEKEALQDILDASRDNEEIFTNLASLRSMSPEAKMKYYARRFFTFLKSIPELKSSLRDEASIEKLLYM